MVATKLTGLSAFTPILTDIIYGVDDPGGTPISGKLTLTAIRDLLQANLTSATITGATLTGSAATTLVDISQTWNTTGAPTAFKLNVTDTASNFNSLLMDLRVGGSSLHSLRKDGRHIFSNTANSETVGLMEGANATTMRTLNCGSDCGVIFASSKHAFQVTVNSFYGFWSGTTLTSGASEFGIRRDEAYAAALSGGTNAMAFRVYNTYTDASNYERGALRWNSNVFELGSFAAGTGMLRGLRVGVSGNSLGFLGATPIAQYSTTGTTTGFTAGAGTAVNDDSTFTGNTGATAYTIGDVVRALKQYGLIAA